MQLKAPNLVSTTTSAYRALLYVFEMPDESMVVIRLKPLTVFSRDDLEDKYLYVQVKAQNEEFEGSSRLRWCGGAGFIATLTLPTALVRRISAVHAEIEGLGSITPAFILQTLFTARVQLDTGAPCINGNVRVKPWPSCPLTLEYMVLDGESAFPLPSATYSTIVFDCGSRGVTWWYVPIEPPETAVKVLVGPLDTQFLSYGVSGRDLVVALSPVEWETRSTVEEVSLKLYIAEATLKPYITESVRLRHGRGILTVFKIPENIPPGAYHARLRLCSGKGCSETLLANILLPF